MQTLRTVQQVVAAAYEIARLVPGQLFVYRKPRRLHLWEECSARDSDCSGFGLYPYPIVGCWVARDMTRAEIEWAPGWECRSS